MRRRTTTGGAPAHQAVDPLAPDEAGSGGGQSKDGRQGAPLRRVVAALALLFLLGPALILAAGGGGRPLARERRAQRPSPAQGWGFFDNASLYLTQRLPLRQRAVDANTWISEHVFGTTPRYGNSTLGADRALPFGGVPTRARGGYAQNGGALTGHAVATVGRDHWVFLQGEIDTLCHPPVSFATAVRRWRTFVHILAASGRNVVLLVVPEKSTIYPERVIPAATPSSGCALAQKHRLWHTIEASGDRDIVSLRQGLFAARQRRPGQLLYLPLDSHWNDLGALLATRTALARVGGHVQVGPSDVRSATKTYTGDIAAFAGGPTHGTAPALTIARPGEGPIALRGSPGGAVTTRPGASPPVIPGTTLFLHDSFGDSVYPLLDHYAARLLIASFLALQPPQMVDLLRRAHTVILETSERDFLKRSALHLPETILSPPFLAALPRELAR